MFDASSPLYYANVEGIKDIGETTPMIETPDAYTVKVYFDYQSMWALQLIGLVPMIPKHVWENIPPEECEAQGEYVTTGNLTGTGAYIIVSHTTGESWLLRANPDYFMFKIQGDINADGVVDIFDAVLLAGAAGSTPSASNWNPDADLNKDLIVDLFDAVILAAHAGQME